MLKNLEVLAAFADFVRYSDFEHFFGGYLAGHLHSKFTHTCDRDPIKFFCSLSQDNKKIFAIMANCVGKREA